MNMRAWVACLCLSSLTIGPAAVADAVPRDAGRHGFAWSRCGRVAWSAPPMACAQRRYTFEPAAHPWLVVTPDNVAWDWWGQGELHVRVQNAMPWAVTLDVEIDSPGQRLQARVGVPAGPAQTLVIPLQATSPRAQGMQDGPPMPFDDAGRLTLLATTVHGTLDSRDVRAIRLGVPAPHSAQTLLFGAMGTLPGENTVHAAYAGIVDRYGQYTRGRWPGTLGLPMPRCARRCGPPRTARTLP
ncbi:hypothetical protein [Rhodanobacter lindaniclasticus]